MNPAGAARRGGWLAPLVLALASALVFGGSLGFGFVIWDDPQNLTENPLFAPPTPGSLVELWTGSFGHLYVPVSYSIWWGIALASDALFGRLEPALFHAANVLLHVLCVLLVFRWLRELVGDARAACAGALFFALHPLQVESVCWLTELRGLASAALGFGALLLALRGRPRLALLLFALALLAKPAAVAFAALILVQDLGWRGRPWREVLRADWPWLALAAGAVWLSLAVQADVEPRSPTPLADRPAVALDALGFYLAKLVWPAGLCAEYGRSPELVLAARNPWPAALALVSAVGFVLLLPERRRALCALAWFGVALLPVLGLVPFGYQAKSTVADRYAYVALAGVGLLVAQLVLRLGLPALAAALALALACGLASVAQSGTWRDTQALFGRVLEINPQSLAAHENLGLDALQRGELERARGHYLRALELAPGRTSSLTNLGVCECRLGRLDEGIADLRAAIAGAPRARDARENLVAALGNGGRLDEAELEARELAALEPGNARNLLPLVRVLRVRGERAEAALLLERVLAELPDWKPALEERAALGPP